MSSGYGKTPSSPLLKLLLVDGFDYSLECLRVVHGEVGEDLAVQADVILGEESHKLGVGHSVLTGGGVDSLNPKSAEIALLSSSVTVGVSKTFFVGVLRDRPNILPAEEVTASSLKNLLAARPGGD